MPLCATHHHQFTPRARNESGGRIGTWIRSLPPAICGRKAASLAQTSTPLHRRRPTTPSMACSPDPSRSVGRNRWLKGRSSGSIFCRCGCRLLGLAASVAERLSKHSVGRKKDAARIASVAPIIAARSRRSSRAPVPRSLLLERTARFLSRWVSRLQCTICATRFVARYPQNRLRLTAFARPVFRLELLQRCGKKTAVPVACLLVTNAPSMLITSVPPTRPHLT